MIRIFLAELAQKLNVNKASSLGEILQDLEAHAIVGFNNYVQVISQHVDIRQVPQVVYVDFVSKFNLVEFFRFSDGAHCCLASDPNVSSQYGTGIYEKQMPRYMANATSFWWQITTDARTGKQIGWYENWFGLENGKVFVGTELNYMSPSHRDKDLQTAITATVEEILFSTHVTKIAQAYFGHHAANALSPPSGYKSQDMTVTKLQSLKDGEPIYEDAPLATNMEVAKNVETKNGKQVGFFVKSNPGPRVLKAKVPGQYNVSLHFVRPQDVTEELVDQLVNIEEQVFPQDKQAGRTYMQHHLTHPQALIFILKDDDTGKIVGYRHSVPATDAWLMPDTPRYLPYKTREVLYQSDIALLPKYWGKANMGDKFREYMKEAKRRGFKYLATHTEHENGIRPGATLSQKYQNLGFEEKWQEPNWGGGTQSYDFLVLDLDKAMFNTHVARNPGGINFNPGLLNLETHGQTADFNLTAGANNMESIHIDNGLLPVVKEVIPIMDLHAVLVPTKSRDEQLAGV